jgi:hypothetical protein
MCRIAGGDEFSMNSSPEPGRGWEKFHQNPALFTQVSRRGFLRSSSDVYGQGPIGPTPKVLVILGAKFIANSSPSVKLRSFTTGSSAEEERQRPVM